MIEAYAKNQSIPATTGIVPFTSVSLKKGQTVELNGVNSIQLNKCGVYEVIFNATALAGTAGNVTIEMTKNGVTQPQATTTITGATTTTAVNVPISTLVQVKDNNSCCCCDAPTILQFLNTGVAITADTNVVVTKVC